MHRLVSGDWSLRSSQGQKATLRKIHMAHAATLLSASVSIAIVTLGLLCQPRVSGGPRGTRDDPIVDSAMTEEEAFEGLDPQCPEAIRKRQKVITLLYYSFDKKIHRGQLVMDAELEADIRKVFALALREKFPIHSVVPISHKRFRKDGRWDDNLSMAANNTSSFNYRMITGGTKLSNHAYGRAIDINPVQNPYIKGDLVLPLGARYNPRIDGTLTADHPVTKAFLKLGWDWGGNWDTRKDYQHFEKPQKK